MNRPSHVCTHGCVISVMSNLRTDVAGYTFLLVNFGSRVAGMSTWLEVRGAVRIKEPIRGVVSFK